MTGYLLKFLQICSKSKTTCQSTRKSSQRLRGDARADADMVKKPPMHKFVTILRSSLLAWPAVLVLTAPAAAAPPPPRTPAPVSSKTPKICFGALFSGPLPGKLDYCLGMRDWNQGHYDGGLSFLKLAAGWGNKNAQYTLGLIYYGGHHVPANPALGLAWLTLANERHDDAQIAQVQHSASLWVTPAQRQQATRLVHQMQSTYSDKVAATRAWQRLQHWRSRHSDFNSGCVRLHGPAAIAARRMGLAGEPPLAIQTALHPYTVISVMGDSAKNLMKAKKEIRQYEIARSGVCVTIQMQHHVTRQLASRYFAGWGGTVTVGPLQQVSQPTSHPEH
ncbi:MAG TPA: hypothetical protein VF269_02715 [Rhodanobacteraceae bacterium]